MRRAAALAIQPTKGTLYMGMGPCVCGLVDNPTLEVHPLKHQGTAGRIWPSVNLKIAIFARFGTMPILGKSPSAKLSVQAPAMARPWARVRPHRLSFLLGGDDPENRLVEEIPAAGFGGRRHAVDVLCLFRRSPRVDPHEDH